MSAQRSTPEENKAFVRRHFEDFVNNGKAQVIRQNMTPDFWTTTGRAANLPTEQPTRR
jgi:hypothetical protein